MSASRSNNNTNSVAYLTAREILSLRYLPGSLYAYQVAIVLGCEEHHISVLIRLGLLKPLGHPPVNAPKHFARDYVLALAADERWLSRMWDALVAHWSHRNSKKNKTIKDKALPKAVH